MARPARPASEITLHNAGQQMFLRDVDLPGSVIARWLGVTPSAVCHYRLGQAKPHAHARRMLAELFPSLRVWLWDLPPLSTQEQFAAAVRVFEPAA